MRKSNNLKFISRLFRLSSHDMAIDLGTVNTVVQAVNLPAPGGGTWPGTQVTVTYVHQLRYIRPIVGIFGGTFANSITLTARSTMRNQVAAAGS